mmetsp:Transcript_9354/g.17848  ORF Transcript_9354/g.17848 Transcript_9354/m.17848 type:complete len:131 (-) Transcript_9354:98-490(-)
MVERVTIVLLAKSDGLLSLWRLVRFACIAIVDLVPCPTSLWEVASVFPIAAIAVTTSDIINQVSRNLSRLKMDASSLPIKQSMRKLLLSLFPTPSKILTTLATPFGNAVACLRLRQIKRNEFPTAALHQV